jgi:asparagine synthase (glutamine-hydrolysing)
VALPDSRAAADVAGLLRAHASDGIPHASGRPWLLGRWRSDEVVVVEAGQLRVAVVAQNPITATCLQAATARLRGIGDLERLRSAMVGSFHLLASHEGRTRVQGSISGIRRVFHTRIGGVTVAADRADILAELAGATLDERWLAMQMLCFPSAHLFEDACPWPEVKGLPSNCYLLTHGADTTCVVPWWRPPDPTVSLAEGAPVLRERLCAAVEARTQAGGTISCDLSGGLDSTSLCFLAAQGGAHLLTATFDCLDPSNDDRVWAERAMEKLIAVGDVECLFFGREEMPLMYAAVQEAGEGVDIPVGLVREQTRLTCLARKLIARGSRRHMGGFGGDAVFRIAPAEAYLHSTARTHPRIALDHLRGHRARCRWPLRAILASLADCRTYREWLAAEVDDLTAPPPPAFGVPQRGWGDLRMPPWATAEAVSAVRDMLLEAAQEALPLAPTRGQHETLSAIRYMSSVVRQLSGAFASVGLPLSDPFLDDSVVEVCLSVRMHERTTPWAYKPLLAEAVRGLVPATVLERSTKGEYSADAYAGMRHHRADLAAVCKDPIMARLGLVDPQALRSACLSMYPPNLSPHALEATLACEVWLRQAHQGAFVNLAGTGDRG